MMKILFINPPYENFSGIKDSAGRSIPLNLAYLASYTRKHVDCSLSVLDAEAFGLSFAEIRKELKRRGPDIICITCPTPAFNHVVKIAKIAKGLDPAVSVVVGGSHPTTFPDGTVDIPEIDFAVRGEGEATFVELVKAIGSGKDSFDHIAGLAYKYGKKVVITKERELIADLDTIPFPARDLFNLDIYYSATTKKVSKYKSTSIMTSRGCPFNCIHCISKLVWKRTVRYRSVGNLVDEIEECVKRYGIQEFNFYDDTFTINKKRVIDVCREIRRRRLKIAWICFARVNTIDLEMVREMKKAGCKKISFGIESGSQRILDIMRKNATLEMARKAVRVVNEVGMEVHASFMLGNVGETRKTLRQTIDFAKSLDLDHATFFITAPFPGTDLYDIAKEKGFITDKTRWEDFAPITVSAPVLVQGNISQSELVLWQKRAFREFYFRPKMIWKKFVGIGSLSDLKMLLQGVGIFFRVSRKKV